MLLFSCKFYVAVPGPPSAQIFKFLRASCPGIGAWQSPPSETWRSSGRMEDWKRCPYLHSLVARRSSGPDSPWPSCPSRACGVWGRRAGLEDEESRTRPSGFVTCEFRPPESVLQERLQPCCRGEAHDGRSAATGGPIVTEPPRPLCGIWAQLLLADLVTVLVTHRWHCWKRGGAALQKYLALPAKIRQRWGRWRSRRVAEDYTQPPEEYKVWTSIKLPWPEGPSKFVKCTTRGHNFWPTALSELFRHGHQLEGQEHDVGSKRAWIVLSNDDTPQRPRVEVRRTVRLRMDGGASPVASAAVGS